jgi:ring-1,2-phenylacetyl-CoA epoxidase subunit PaaD
VVNDTIQADANALERRAHEAAASVPDPEIPCLTVADLGILRSVEIDDGVAIARLTPT